MPTTIHELIAQIRTTSGSDAECGSRFERLMLAYLRSDPMWFSRFSQVWLWADWPGREGEVDTGIDLVAAHRDGSGFTERMIIASTNRLLQPAPIGKDRSGLLSIVGDDSRRRGLPARLSRVNRTPNAGSSGFARPAVDAVHRIARSWMSEGVTGRSE